MPGAERFVIAVDGGATKTDCVVGETGGRVLASRGTGPVRADCFATGFHERCEADWENLVEVTRGAMDDAGLSGRRADLLVLALNGVDLPGDEDKLRAAVEPLALAGKVLAANDAVAGLWAASREERCAYVSVGSAFTAAGRRSWGEEFLFDHLSQGGPANIRTLAIHSTVRMLDGRMERTALAERLLERSGARDGEELCRLLYTRSLGRDFRQSLPALVFEAEEEGDEAAVSIVERAGADYGLAARAILGRIGAGGAGAAAVFGGGVFCRSMNARLLRAAEAVVREEFPDAAVGYPAARPVVGALLWGLFDLGGRMPETFDGVLDGLPEELRGTGVLGAPTES